MAARMKAADLARLTGKAKKPPAPREKDVQKAILAYLLHAGVFAWRCNSGVQFVAGRKIALAPPGTADILGCLSDGRFLGIEVKRPRGGRLSDVQRAWLDTVNRQGGLAFVATSPLAVYEALTAEGYLVVKPN